MQNINIARRAPSRPAKDKLSTLLVRCESTCFSQ
jgi:hypothetical protein